MTVLTETIDGLDGSPSAVNTGNSAVTPAAGTASDGAGPLTYAAVAFAAVLSVGALWSAAPVVANCAA